MVVVKKTTGNFMVYVYKMFFKLSSEKIDLFFKLLI